MEMSSNRMASPTSSTRRRPTVISDDERREVAARLRACARDVSGTLDFAMYLSNWVGIEGVADDGGNHFSGAADRRCAERTLEKLADLIDRPTCRNLGLEEGTNGEDYDFFCSRCGFASDVVDPGYCPHCGAEVVE